VDREKQKNSQAAGTSRPGTVRLSLRAQNDIKPEAAIRFSLQEGLTFNLDVKL
jgi:hypothetical protein